MKVWMISGREPKSHSDSIYGIFDSEKKADERWEQLVKEDFVLVPYIHVVKVNDKTDIML